MLVFYKISLYIINDEKDIKNLKEVVYYIFAMPLKITKKKFIETIENNDDGYTIAELSGQMGITTQYFYYLRKRYRNEIVDAAREMVKHYAAEAVLNLAKNMRNKDTKAALAILEMVGAAESDRKIQVDINIGDMPTDAKNTVSVQK